MRPINLPFIPTNPTSTHIITTPMGSSVSKPAHQKTKETTRRSHARHQANLNGAAAPAPGPMPVPRNGDKFAAQRVYAQQHGGAAPAAPAAAAGWGENEGKETVILVSGGEGGKGRKMEVDRKRGVVIRHKRVKP